MIAPERWNEVLDVNERGTYTRVMAMIEDSHIGIHFRLEFVIAINAGLNWLRLVVML